MSLYFIDSSKYELVSKKNSTFGLNPIFMTNIAQNPERNTRTEREPRKKKMQLIELYFYWILFGIGKMPNYDFIFLMNGSQRIIYTMFGINFDF